MERGGEEEEDGEGDDCGEELEDERSRSPNRCAGESTTPIVVRYARASKRWVGHFTSDCSREKSSLAVAAPSGSLSPTASSEGIYR